MKHLTSISRRTEIKRHCRFLALLSLLLSVFAGSQADGQTFTTLHSLTSAEGFFLYGGLVQGSDGNFYGPAEQGGAHGVGDIFKITPGGTFAVIYSFGSVAGDGSFPLAGLTQGSDGNFYGTTTSGGSNGHGTVFKITPAGILTTLYSLGSNASDGNLPGAALVLGTDGSFYGTTYIGGSGNSGTVFRLTTDGTPAGTSFTTIYSFSAESGGANSDGGNPCSHGHLLQRGDGNFYGTTQAGGSTSRGTIFKITPAGILTTLYVFGSHAGDGASPLANLVQDSSGVLYGTTASGGLAAGTAFRVVTDGSAAGTSLTTLYSFLNSTNGGAPDCPLVLDADGNLYGMTDLGGTSGGDSSNSGTLFQVTPAGAITTFYSFGTKPGEGQPHSGLVRGIDGAYYGTTKSTIFKFASPSDVPAPPPHGGLSATVFKVNGSKSPMANVADTALRFAALQTGVPAGLEVSVQATTTPGDATSWTNLPNGNGGFMSYDASTQQFVLSSTNYPLQNGVYFRAKSVATSYPDSISNVVGPFNLSTNQSHLGPTTLYMSRNGPVANIRFGVTETTIPSGITVRIETTDKPASEASWVDAPIGSSGHLIQDLQPPPGNPNEFYLGSDDYPSGEGVYFRAVASASGSIDSISSVFGPFAFILDPAPTIGITISVPPGGTTSGSGTIDDPVVVSSRSFNVTATAHSGREIKYLALKYDGDTLQSFDGAASEGNTVQYTTNIPGDHLIEAVARDDIGVVGDAPPLHIRVAPSAPGQIFTMIQSGDWSTAANWNDSQGNIGVPGSNDFAVLGSNNASLSQDVTVNAVSLGVISAALNGGTVSGPATLTVTGFCTIGSGRVTNDLTIAAGAVCELINDDDIGLGGHVTNYGTWKVHGKGGITGIPNSTSQKAMLVNGTSDVSAFGFFDGVVAFFKNVGDVIFHRPAGGRPGSGSAKPRPPNPPPAPDNRRARVNMEQAGGKIVADTGDGVVSHDGGSVVSHDGGSLITQDGGSLIGPSTNVVSHDGGSVVSHDGGSVVSHDGGSIVATGGGNLVGNSGGTLVSNSGGTFQTSGGSNSSAQNVYAATAASGFTQTGGETDLSSISIVGPVTLNGGVLSGSGVIQGDLTNNGGYISPGHSAGLLAVTGNFTQGSNGTLIVENGGPSPSQFDQLQIGGVANLGGKLDIKTINGYTPDPADTFSPLGYSSVSGSFASVSSNAQVTVNASGLLTSVDPTKPQPSTGQPLNIATRLQIQSGDNVLIAGFIITGPAGSTKKVLIRGIGPSLANFGVAGTIPDPFLELHKPDGSVVTNDNWKQAPNVVEIPSGFAPSNDLESIIYTTLSPGNYTAILKGAHGEAGVGLVEAYDFDTASTAKLANIATRGFVNTGDNVMIGGFIIGGTEPANILVRAIGPSLTQFGVQGALQATTLELHDSNGSVISNEGWRSTQESDIQATTIPPTNDNEAAILATLVPGNYTAIVRGKNDTTGIAVVEAYNLQ
jgi:uncharacterized repeat protein (TIGR03803 family)